MQIRATAESDESHPSAMEMESKRIEPNQQNDTMEKPKCYNTTSEKSSFS